MALRFSILVLTKDPSSQRALRCFSAIKSHTDEKDYELLILRDAPNRFEFAKNINRLLSITHGENIILVNDDCIVSQCWAEKLNSMRADIVSGLPSESKGFAAFGCVLIRRKVIERIGLLDESYPFGFEDNEYSSRAETAHLKVSSIEIGAIHHANSSWNGRARRLRTKSMLIHYIRNEMSIFRFFYDLLSAYFHPLDGLLNPIRERVQLWN